MSTKALHTLRLRRAHRVRARMKGSADIPRLSIFRSNRYTAAQLIDDEKRMTLVSVSSREEKKHASKIAGAEYVGATIAARAKKLNITKAIADRGSYRYHGRVKALIEAARSAGLAI